MLIESIIQREGGSFIDMGTKVYHFVPDDQGRHVCYVDVPSHARRLMEIPEGFRCVEERGQVGLALSVTEEPTVTNDGREALAAEYERVIGKRPHHKMSFARMRAEIAAAQVE